MRKVQSINTHASPIVLITLHHTNKTRNEHQSENRRSQTSQARAGSAPSSALRSKVTREKAAVKQLPQPLHSHEKETGTKNVAAMEDASSTIHHSFPSQLSSISFVAPRNKLRPAGWIQDSAALSSGNVQLQDF